MASQCLGFRSLFQSAFKSRRVPDILRTQRSFSSLSTHHRPAFAQPHQLRTHLWPRSLTHAQPSLRSLSYPAGNSVFPNLRRWLSTSRPTLRHYVPPSYQRKPEFLGFLDKIPENYIFFGIIGINAAVFTMWFLATSKYRQEGDPSAVVWMRNNFTTSWDNIASGKIWTPLTSCFSHSGAAHILFNGFTFFFMARPVLSILGSRQFLFLYLGGGLISSFASLTYASWSNKINYSSHGASGAIFSIVSLLACVAPTMKFYIYGILPVPAWLAVTGLFTYDMYSTLTGKTGTTDTAGHVGGVLAGILYFVVRRFRIF